MCLYSLFHVASMAQRRLGACEELFSSVEVFNNGKLLCIATLNFVLDRRDSVPLLSREIHILFKMASNF